MNARAMTRRGGRVVRIGSAVVSAVALGALLPAVASAHPLGNFTINHYAGITIGEKAIRLDVVLDLAEIPTFTERQRIDTDGDGAVSARELEAERIAACPRLASELRLTVDGRVVAPVVEAAGLSFPAGAGGLPTMRLVCEYSASAPEATGPRSVGFADTSYAERIGWRELVVRGDGVTVAAAGGEGFETASPSARLTHYPTDLLARPLDERSLDVVVSPGGPPAAPFTAPDARPLAGTTSAPSTASTIATMASLDSVAAAVPGGVGDELAGILGSHDLTLPAIAGSLLVALLLGAVHAASPGHGKTIMAAYLVGSQGTGRHAVILGLTVTASHTLGVLGLAAVTLLAADILPPERLYPFLGVGSGLLVVAIGGWLLATRARAPRGDHVHNHHPGVGDDGHTVAHTHGPEHAHGPEHGHGHDHGHAHDHGHGDATSPASGGSSRSSTLGLRRLVALGLAGGLVPSASALLLLLGSLAAGRPLFGFVLVVAFGAGMAIVLAGLGLALVHATALVGRLSGRPAGLVGPLARWTPIATAVVVVVAGCALTVQALHQVL